MLCRQKKITPWVFFLFFARNIYLIIFYIRFGAYSGHNLNNDQDTMTELQSKYSLFVDILQENYHDTVDKVADSAGTMKRYYNRNT